MQKKKILFVCLGNICRSPMMEYVFRAEAESRGVADMFEAASAGTSGEEAGNPVYPPARRELAAHGIGCDGKRARKLTEDDYRRFDLIVTAEERNSRAASRIFGGDPRRQDMSFARFLHVAARYRRSMVDGRFQDRVQRHPRGSDRAFGQIDRKMTRAKSAL